MGGDDMALLEHDDSPRWIPWHFDDSPSRPAGDGHRVPSRSVNGGHGPDGGRDARTGAARGRRATGLVTNLSRMYVTLTSQIHLRHKWITVEAIGRVVTQRCANCRRIRVRVHGG
ncbi:hypothetical protein [Sphaerisporangium dianthi]|uniref:Uncharacterized protein n=1 Tax=Sphaerisporangium dianthi TaxID=1436120 RepID=A0ABV9CHE6_9ACTN